MDLRKTLFALGVPTTFLDTALQYIYMLPETIDPDTQGPIILIRALQTGLQQMGFPVMVNGIFDDPTVRALNLVSPPANSWRVKTWAQLIADIVAAAQHPFGVTR